MMANRTRTREPKAGDRRRPLYRFTATQVLKMVDDGTIADGEDVELWDGIIYRIVKGELHCQIVMLTARALTRVADPDTYHVREEKSCSDGPHSLPEPDVAVKRAPLGVLTPRPPDLKEVALIVEVDHHTARADRVVKYSRYAERRIPVYWHIKAERRIVLVHDLTQGEGVESHYARMRRYASAGEVPIVLDGQEVGRVAAARLFPTIAPTSRDARGPSE